MSTATVLETELPNNGQPGSPGTSLFWSDDDTAKPNRVKRPSPHQFSLIEQALLVAASEQFWNWAQHMPRNTEIVGIRGRKPKAPDYVKALLITLWAATPSMHALVTELSFPPTWQLIRTALDKHRPSNLLPAPASCPSLSQMKSFNARLRSMDVDELTLIQESVHEDAVLLAKSQGFLVGETAISYRNPDPSRFVALDGTVMKQAFGRGNDDSVGLQVVCNDEKAKFKPFGAKIVTTSVRNDHPGGRLLLRIDSVLPGPNGAPGGESGTVEMATRRISQLTGRGLQGVIVDSVIRGKVVFDLARDGLITVNYPHALSNPNRRDGGRNAQGRVERSVEVTVATHSVRGLKRPCEHPVLMRGGNPATRICDENGDEQIVPLTIRKASERANKDGTFRYYHEYSIPCVHGEFGYRHPLFPEDGSSINYGEVTRYFPPNSDQFKFLYGRRNDTESWHRQLKRRAARMPVRGLHLQSVYLCGLLISQNAQTVERMRLIEESPPRAAAA